MKPLGSNGILTPEQRRALVEAPLPQIRIYGSTCTHGGTYFHSLYLVGPGRERCPRTVQDQHDTQEAF